MPPGVCRAARGPPDRRAALVRRVAGRSPERQPGVDWDNQIRDAIQACPGLLFVMTGDSVQDHSVCKPEWAWALKYKKPVIPLRVDADADLPFGCRHGSTSTSAPASRVGLAKLRLYLGGMGSPRWVLQDLRNQLTEAERELPRSDPARRPRIEQDIGELRQRVADQERLLADPGAANRRTEERIAAGLERERQPERPSAAPARAKFVNTPPVVAPGYFQDRHVESELVGDFLRTDGARIMTVVGRGGVGKTAMVCRLLKALEGGHLPDDLGELAVDGIVYLSPAGGAPGELPQPVRRPVPAAPAGNRGPAAAALPRSARDPRGADASAA